MRYLSKYNNYLIERLLESILVTSSEFKKIIHDMPETDKIADILYTIIDDKNDIKTNYNLIDNSKDKNDEISFLPDSQYQRFITKGDDVTTKTKSTGFVGRMIRQILKDNGHTQFTDSDIEKFTNNFKSTWNKKHGITTRKTEVVKGKDILKWYNISNYNSSNGTLGNSCMRYEKVNHFMNIYAENPDKISMVIITEENKLLARALFWILDETSLESTSQKFYLDRIYTEQDSDVNFIYDWVVENLCDKDPKKLYSHKQGHNSDFNMKVFLKKTTFEHYPYADTFNYLYQRIDKEGKLIGDGYVTNRTYDSLSREERENITKNYVISEIRNHSEGRPSRLSHHYSEHFGIFINKNEAVRTDLGYVPKSMCKKCEYLDEWIYQDDAVWSESMEDWIPKSGAIETEKFGLVYKDAISYVATKYIGRYTHVIDVCKAIDEEGDTLFEKEIRLGVDSSDFYTPERRYGLRIDYFSDDLLGKDFWSEYQIKVTCNQMFDCGSWDDVISNKDIQPFASFVVKEWRDRAYLTENHAILFGLTPNKESSKLISFYDIKEIYKLMDYELFVSFVRNSKISESLKSEIIDDITKYHEFLIENDSRYKREYQIRKKLKGLTHKELYLNFYKSVWNQLLEKELGISDSIKREFEYYGIEPNEENIDLGLKIIDALVLVFISYQDTSDSRTIVNNWLEDSNELKIKINKIKPFRDFTEICRRIFRDDLRDEVISIISDEKDEFAKKYDFQDSDVLYRYIRDSVNFHTMNPF